MAAFSEDLDRRIRSADSHVCVGLDPVAADMPGGVKRDVDGIREFLCRIVDATAAHAVAYKPNAAFYEVFGPAGYQMMIDVVDHVHDNTDAIVILDVKRGDVGHTARAYAQACYDTAHADAVTVSPYLGRDSVAPFAEDPSKGVFVLARTSNGSAGDLQDLRVDRTKGGETGGTAPLYIEVARSIVAWNEHGNLGLVAGGTWPGEIQRLREAVGDGVPFLVPGVGAQGGDARTAARAAADTNGRGFLINSGRGIVHASSGDDHAAAAGRAAAKLQADIAAALATPNP